ncbi:CLEC-50 protein [Aphelenchoides avenae]|nr:CLEC-50 protein [Aphelenchus avenae]
MQTQIFFVLFGAVAAVILPPSGNQGYWGWFASDVFLFATKPLSFNDAENDCVQRGGHLVAIPDKTANAAVQKLAPENCVDAYWIGARIVRGGFNWTDPDIPFAYVNCAGTNGCKPRGQNPKAGGLTFNVGTGMWHYEADVASKKPYICLLTEGTNVTDSSVTASTCVCEPGWSYLKNTDSCYKVILGPATWNDLEAKCKLLGAHLASIHNYIENAFIRQLSATKKTKQPCNKAARFCEPSVAIGLFLPAGLKGTVGPWRWSDGTDFNLAHWWKGRPYPTISNRTSVGSIYPDPVNAPGGQAVIGYWNELSEDWTHRAGVCKKGKPAQLNPCRNRKQMRRTGAQLFENLIAIQESLVYETFSKRFQPSRSVQACLKESGYN